MSINQCQAKLLLCAIFSRVGHTVSINHEAKINTCGKKTCSCSYFPSVITYSLDFKYKVGKVTLSADDMMNQILPALAPLLIVLFSYWLLGRKKMNSTKLIFVLIALGMLLGNLKNIF